MLLFACAQGGQDASPYPALSLRSCQRSWRLTHQMHFVCEPTPARDRNRICSTEHEQDQERGIADPKRKKKNRMRVRTS